MSSPPDFDPGSRRSLVMNVTQLVKQLLDGYEQKESEKSHWLQKDGIQNCWDARKDAKKGKGWKCIIELIENKDLNLLTITDFGTWGLTGKRLSQKDLMKDQPIEERWSRFENLAFANDADPNRELLGSRGRGKFVFIGVSKTKETLYDTLREDKVYRLGKRILEKTDSPTWAEEGDKAKEILKNNTKNLLTPIDHVGTRVIIPEPIDEIIKDIKNGKFAQYIGDTWWEIIEKFQAEIIIKINGVEKRIESFTKQFPKKPHSKNQKILDLTCIKIPNNKSRIKKLYLFYDKDKTFDERTRGIAIQRAGMNICRLPLDELGPNLSPHISGYVTCERDFDSEMRRCEGQEHYDFMWNRIPAKDLKIILTEEYRKFAESQLGWKALKAQKAAKGQKNAEYRALKLANKVAKHFGFGIGPGTTKPRPPPGPPRPSKNKEIQILLNQPTFPNTNSERVNYGQSLKDISARIINKSPNQISVRSRIMIRSVERGEVIERIYINDDHKIDKNIDTPGFGNKQLKINSEDYAPGHYKIYADIVLLIPVGKYRKGFRLDKSEISFYVEQDPPEGGIFEKFEAVDFDYLPKPRNMLRALHEPASRPNTYIIEYSTKHNDFEQFGKDEDSLSEYLYRLALPELCMIDVENEWKKLFTAEDLNEDARILSRMNEILGEYTGGKWLSEI